MRNPDPLHTDVLDHNESTAMGPEDVTTQCISSDSANTTAISTEAATASRAEAANTDAITAEANTQYISSDSANKGMDYLYYAGSIALVGCLIAIEAGTGTNVVETVNTVSYIFGLAWNSGDGVGTAAIAYNEMDVAQTLNAVQLFTVPGLVLSKTITAPFASASFALAMGITAVTERNNYVKKQSEADKIWVKFKESKNKTKFDSVEYNKKQTEALKHKDAAVAYSFCTIAMGIVAAGAFAATGPVAPATFLIASILTVGISAYSRYLAQKNKASEKYNYDHLALRQLEEIEGTLPALIPTSTCQNIKRYLTCCIFSKPDTAIDDAKIEKIPMPEALKGQYQSYTCADLTELNKNVIINYKTVEQYLND